MARRDQRSSDLPEQRALPFSEESERAVLGGLLLEPEELARVRSRLDPRDFYVERHQVLYRQMLAVVDSGAVLDLRTLQAQLELSDVLDFVGGLAYLSSLDLDLPDMGRLEYYADIVKDRSMRRELVKTGQDLIRGGLTSAESVSELVAALRKAGDAIETGAVRSRWQDAVAVVSQVLESIEEGQGSGLTGLQTGFAGWDRLGPGLLPNALIVLAGRPGMGKTSLAMDLVRQVAVVQGRPVGVFSLEQSAPELGLKLLSSGADMASRYIRAGHLSQRQWSLLFNAARQITPGKILLDESPGLTLAELEARALLLQREQPELALLVVDYLQLVTAGQRLEHRRLEVALIARRLKLLAGKLGVPVVALSQLNRSLERRSDPRPVMSDLSESGAIEQDADMVAFVHRPEVYTPDDPELKGLAELIIAKYRHGETGIVDLIWSGATTSFRNPAAPDSGPPTERDLF